MIALPIEPQPLSRAYHARWPGHAGPDIHAANPVSVALAMVGMGVRVLPITRKKVPMMRGWPERAWGDPRQIWRWSAHREGNFGVLTGDDNARLVVLDADGPEGLAGLAASEARLGPLPPTWRASTGRPAGGAHVYLRRQTHQAVVQNSVSTLARGVDVRGWHGFVVAPGGLHKSGNRYAWEVSPAMVELGDLPDAWAAELARLAGNKPSAKPRSRPGPRSSVVGPDNDAGSIWIGDGPGLGGFHTPIFRWACRYFSADPSAPAEPLIAALAAKITAAPKGPDRDVSRYLDPAYLSEQAERARARSIEYLVNKPLM